MPCMLGAQPCSRCPCFSPLSLSDGFLMFLWDRSGDAGPSRDGQVTGSEARLTNVGVPISRPGFLSFCDTFGWLSMPMLGEDMCLDPLPLHSLEPGVRASDSPS